MTDLQEQGGRIKEAPTDPNAQLQLRYLRDLEAAIAAAFSAPRRKDQKQANVSTRRGGRCREAARQRDAEHDAKERPAQEK